MALQFGPRPLTPAWVNPRDDSAELRARIARERARRKASGITEREEDAIRRVEDAELEAETDRIRIARQRRDANWPRERLLFLASLLVTGASNNAVSVIGFVDQERDGAGKSIVLSPRVGLETEPIVDRMKVRLGTYLEPSRYELGFPRQHFTFGSDIKLFRFKGFWFIPENDICAIGAIDVAPRFVSIGASICVWR
jgi:hypothetical protein